MTAPSNMNHSQYMGSMMIDSPDDQSSGWARLPDDVGQRCLNESDMSRNVKF